MSLTIAVQYGAEKMHFLRMRKCVFSGKMKYIYFKDLRDPNIAGRKYTQVFFKFKYFTQTPIVEDPTPIFYAYGDIGQNQYKYNMTFTCQCIFCL